MPTKTAPAPAAGNAKSDRALTAGVRGLHDNQLACRDMRHAWAVEQDYHVIPSQSVGKKVLAVKRVLVCMRGCDVRRVERYDATKTSLHRVSRYYEYPESYRLPGVPPGVKPSTIVQQESYRRAMERAASLGGHEAAAS